MASAVRKKGSSLVAFVLAANLSPDPMTPAQIGKHESRIVWSTIANGGQQLRNQCAKCGELWGGALKSELAQPRTPQADAAVAAQFKAHRKDELRQAAIRLIERQNGWWRRYNEYLQTPEWFKRRAAVIRRANGLCEGCLRREATQVHHLTYAHVTKEFLWELRAVCDECHERVHQKEDAA